MRYRPFDASGLIVVGMLILSARPADAQTVATGPYYATPSWDQTLPCTTTTTCPRFVVLANMNDEAVLDRETGLVWERTPDTSLGTASWPTAQFQCNQKRLGNRMGWRLPTLQELTSLIDPSVSFPAAALPVGHPFANVQSGVGSRYWTATSDGEFPLATAWLVTFSNGGNLGEASKSGGSWSWWCVRGGHGVEAQ
jgi:hypothetical protein